MASRSAACICPQARMKFGPRVNRVGAKLGRKFISDAGCGVRVRTCTVDIWVSEGI